MKEQILAVQRMQDYQKMRGLSVDEVKRTNGRIDFEDALLGERGV